MFLLELASFGCSVSRSDKRFEHASLEKLKQEPEQKFVDFSLIVVKRENGNWWF